jgi:hypothetical protein
VNRWSYGQLQPAIRNLIDGWFKRSWAARSAPDEETFEPFIYCWIAFNAWGAAVTEVDQDRAIIDRLASDESVDEEFQHLLNRDADFRRAAEQFRRWWPIFSAKAIRRGGHVNQEDSGVEHRPARVQRLLSVNPRFPREPRLDDRPLATGNDFPLNWESSLRAIYRVRCNLFHGEKSVSSEADAGVVGAAFRVLVRIFERLLRAEH